MFARSGEITEPRGLPVSGSDHLPSSITPAFSHFWISRSMRGSATRCSTNLTTQLLSRLSKDTTTHYPPQGPTGAGEDYSPAGIYKRNLLETRVIIASYNDHCPAPFYPSLHGWFWHHQVYSGLGAGIVMESITLTEICPTPVRVKKCYRDISTSIV